MKEAIKSLLLAGHHVSLASNCRISPNCRWIVVNNYLSGNTEKFESRFVDYAVDRYLEIASKQRPRLPPIV